MAAASRTATQNHISSTNKNLFLNVNISVRGKLYEKLQPENMAVTYLHSPHCFSDLNLELLSNSVRGSKMSGTGSRLHDFKLQL